MLAVGGGVGGGAARSGAWRTTQFKKYNFEAKGVPPVSGHFHPLLKVREEFRKIFFEMGCARGAPIMPACAVWGACC